jgi:hypothetical protein
MTDLHNRELSDAQLDAIASLDTNLADDKSLLKAENTELRRRVADAELRAMNAVAAEDVAQFAFETAKLRANRFETAFKASSMRDLKATVPEVLENSVEALADALVDEIATGTDYDELDIDGHIQSWMEGRQ